MRTVWMIAIGALACAVSAYAGDYLMNDTGKTVTCLVVAFSEPVVITSFGDTLMSVDLKGESPEFVFYGGSVEAWGGHWLNWEPASAAIESYEWLEELPSGSGWERLFGPPGGYIETLAVCQAVPSMVYASGSDEGIYKTTDGGLQWTLLPFREPANTSILLVNPWNPDLIYSGHDGLSRSTDGGVTWQNISRGLPEEYHSRWLRFSPADSSVLYVAVRRHDATEIGVLKSTDSGQSWVSISPSFAVPRGCAVGAFTVQRDGVLFLGVNDHAFLGWGGGKLFASYDDGRSWVELDYGQWEPRFIWSVFVNPWEPSEVWVSEGPLYNTSIEQPIMYRSDDNGRTWQPVFFRQGGYDSSQVRVIGASADGSVYVAAGSSLHVTKNDGGTFRNITPSRDLMMGVDFFDIEVHPEDSDVLYLPLRCSGIAYSEDGGRTWTRRDQGISSISPNLIEADPFHPEIVYASSIGGQGVFRSEDYGNTWSQSLAGIAHPFGDEIDPDPHREGTVWFVSDVPYIQRSTDYGDTWEVIVEPRGRGGFNFESVYAIGLGSDRDRIYVVDNGFGIFRGTGGHASGQWDWWFLRDSEVDYTYSIAVHPDDPGIVYSGYSPKPFQDWAMVRQTTDGGDTWRTALHVPNSNGVTSVAIDPSKPDTVYAGSTGEGGALWVSYTAGDEWDTLNQSFFFATIHSQNQLAIDPTKETTLYAAPWGAGLFKTVNGGATWTAVDSLPTLSIASLAVHPRDPDILYAAGRADPILYRSEDGGRSWEALFDAGPRYARLFKVKLDTNDPDTVYVAAFRHDAVLGSLFRIQNGEAADITGTIPRAIIEIEIDPTDSQTLYVSLHGEDVYKSIDGGANWDKLDAMPVTGVFDIAIDPSNPDILYAAVIAGRRCPPELLDSRFFAPVASEDIGSHGVYKSVDGGLSWENVNRDVLQGPFRALDIHPDNPGVIYAAGASGFYVSTDDGDSWTKQISGLDYSSVGALVVGANKVYAGTRGGGVYVGEIDPLTYVVRWIPTNGPRPEIYNIQIVVDPTDSDVIYASSYPGGLFKTTDGGATWKDKNFFLPSFEVDDPNRQGYYRFVIDPTDPNRLYFAIYGKGIYVSNDGGDSQMPLFGENNEMRGKLLTDITVNPLNPDEIYAATTDGIYRTTDGGRTWKEAQQGLPSRDVRIVAFAPSGALYAGTRGYGLFAWKSSRWQAQNPVGEWGVIWPIWNDRPRYQYTDVLFHSTDDQKILIGTFPAGIYKSEDGGETWRESNVGWTLDGVFSLISHPEDPDIVYAGTYNGVNRSLDFGEHWEKWDGGWPSEQWVFTIAFDPENPETMYACSKNGENEGAGRPEFHGTVMKSTDGGRMWFPVTEGLDLEQEFYDLIVDPFNSSTLYLAGQHSGMYISTDAAATWKPWNEGLRGTAWQGWNEGLQGIVPATNGNNVTRMLALSGDCRYIYFGSYEAGIFRREIHPEAVADDESRET